MLWAAPSCRRHYQTQVACFGAVLRFVCVLVALHEHSSISTMRADSSSKQTQLQLLNSALTIFDNRTKSSELETAEKASLDSQIVLRKAAVLAAEQELQNCRSSKAMLCTRIDE